MTKEEIPGIDIFDVALDFAWPPTGTSSAVPKSPPEDLADDVADAVVVVAADNADDGDGKVVTLVRISLISLLNLR